MKKAYLSLFLICTFLAHGQKKETQEQLERRKQQILVEINIVRDLLKKEKTKERNILSVISENNRKISLNRQLISNVQKQIAVTNANISKTQKEVDSLETELAKLRKEYADLVLKSYKTKSSQSKLMFVLSSDNFLQAYKRVQYMKQYADYRKSQAEEVKEKAEALKAALSKLSSQKATQQKLLVEQQNNEKELQEDLGEQQNLMSVVQQDQKKYNEHIKKKQEETKAIDRKIKQLIKEAIEEANRIAREKAAREGKKTTKSTTSSSSATAFELTPEGKIVADNFRSNQGKLPWPVSKGYISLPYGDQPHPVQTQLTIHNSGVEITTEAGARARAVFGGEVLQVQVLPGGNKAVLIQHGDYITVYQNLADVSVKKGDKVSLKQDIGSISTNSTGQTVLKFLLSRNTDIYNPQSWLSRSN
ncbi:MAG: peptidoglycan DD-metalloendopeptidase family protein [Myroides sp.]|jgi:septal ring factor EnvC (AmiA/AmiB activator)|uniref:murein hydrolase activator EnvC family protein n=1 Tax=Myroides marinus TaxID=703342 RepID=UPI0025786AC9|nr:peptidoglycan DD-metalloendopeptidase family protein [Myroides marinus]MDM1360645.1 peptidoglycan DD-metalloendopeptidase family protein [Myroides marinus]MDR0196257.1 peptidoglycan DD-metalloendopeptidase family protein [Myroides sp.]